MTPEQRAAEIVDIIASDADFYGDGRVSSSAAKEAMEYAKSAIVAAIRAAVNDAVEMAAKRAEDPTCTYIPGSIRMLKYSDLK